MIKANPNYFKLPVVYLFQQVAKTVKEYKDTHPNADVISLGIGDVTQPIPMASIEAMHKATDEMAKAETLRGYGPEQGYEFLRKAIIENDYKAKGIDIALDEIFISDGSKCDVGNIQEIFDVTAKVAIPDPVYPVYRDTNIMAGRELTFLPCKESDNFSPSLPQTDCDLIYLCSPNNPTGSVMTKEDLKKWVKYAKEKNAIIIFDSAYKEYIRTPGIPQSIYEIEGAKEVAIELRSFSKTAGFTGVRCAYMVIPHALKALDPNGKDIELNPLWARRHTTKFNGVAYIVQRGAEAIYTEAGKKQVKATIDYYMENARLIRTGLKECGFEAFGGIDAPYIWMKAPNGVTSVKLFEALLTQAEIISTPGSGFGTYGEGYVRLTSFGTRENTIRAIERIGKIKL
ncbi:MAG: LL-diaminopimelate aminotransferase [Alphaproteobacteria bacterium]|nr:LL-diaminopimelate aminotransferase [Alphaproteobacteria bacterium]